ncbi:6-bladed beta-propeller [Bacteroides heparinolyticus]|uniref:6-bladed beta-propeller n=1 Tax=Prevotella heparinolytica TaxID=28113 RepID=UPI0023F126E5|nr:6-bladed beta-propeller [Bacteroides heparinolyticus]MCF0258177.1 6-bladed beta-propeller [Bacteroides heparinolyticus]MCI6214096.1 6-bladed beta-propeller [Bacteroides heparinolyticus]
MNFKGKIITIVSLLFIYGCGKRSAYNFSVPIKNIEFSALEKLPISDFESGKKKEYVLLKGLCEKELLGRIDKAKIFGERIYIADTRMRSLVVYDRFGSYISTVGVRGQGPGEYVNLSDFDINKSGNIYVLDARLKKILHYNELYKYVDEHKLPFDADVFAVLDNDSLLFGLSSWNAGEGSGDKIALADKKGQVGKTYLPYDDFTDPSFWISGYQFAGADNGFAYNQTIDNNIYLLSSSGDLKEIIRIDFGKENVPNEDKTNVESKLQNYDDYILIRKILSVTNQYIIGFIWQHRKTKLFVIDRICKKCYLSDVIADIDRRVGCGYSNGNLISYIDSESKELPDSVNQFVKKDEGFVLKILQVE